MEPDIVSLEEYLCHLKTKHERFLKLGKYLSRGNSLSKEEEMAYYEEFNTILNLISSDLNMERRALESIALQAAFAIIFYLPVLKWVQNKARPSPPLAGRTFYNLVKDIRSKLEVYIKVLQMLETSSKPSHEGQLSWNLHSFHSYCPVDATRVFSFQGQESSNENEPWDKERYLCISDGFVIHCLDLKHGKSKDCGPEVRTLKLLEMGFPVSMGLLKLGSDVLMVSGQVFPSFKKHPDLKLSHRLYKKYGFKGSSRKTYQLSLADCGLYLSEYGFPLLKKPKFWPIVEKIGRQIHVIESLPGCFEPPFIIPSHEVLNLDDPNASWTKLSPMRRSDEEFGVFIANHVVAGDRIYAKTYGGASGFSVFESKLKKWEWHEGSCYVLEDAVCVMTLVKPGYKEPLYVLIKIYETRKEDETEIKAVAFLVTATLHVLCQQDLPHFFLGLKGRDGFKGLEGQLCLFSVDEEEEKLCVVVRGLHNSDSQHDFLFVSTFIVVEADPKHHLPFSAISAQSDIKVKGESPIPGEEDFVNVIVKDRYVFKVGNELRVEGDLCARLSACFM